MSTGNGLYVATLVSWLATEALGAFMVRSWIASGGARAARQRPVRPEVMSLPVLVGHAGLNLAGLACWIVFVTTHAKPAAWIALVLLAPAIGLGISTVTIWTPYPAPRHQAGEHPEVTGSQRGVLPDDVVKRALDDDALSRRLVDELLERNLAPPPQRTAGWHLRPLVPAGHGVLAIATFTLALVSAVAAG